MRPLLVFALGLALASCGGGQGADEATVPSEPETTAEPAVTTPPEPAKPLADRFDSARAWSYLKYQVGLGERPAGSRASRKLAEDLAERLPNSRFQKVRGGLRNVIGEVPGRDPDRVVLVGAAYDTRDIEGFVGANDGAAGTAIVLQLAREIEPRTIRPTLLFAFFDGEEIPAHVPESQFARFGLRGSKLAARKLAKRVDKAVVLDFVGDRDLAIPREEHSDARMWSQLRAAARRAGAISAFPVHVAQGVIDDHIPFRAHGVPAIDLIDFNYPCHYRTCDDLDMVSEESLDKVGETMRELLPRL
jgi:hypothetical protein